MYTSFQLIKKYLHYYCTAANGKGHGIHSPFVFDFVWHVLNNKKQYLPPSSIEQVRKELLHDKQIIDIEDLGAGSRIETRKQRAIQQVAVTAVKPKKYSQLFYRLVRHYKPQTIIELGTSLGITTAYIAMANPAAQVFTIEGSTALGDKAKSVFDRLAFNIVQVIQGNFDTELPVLLQKIEKVNLAYIDGNHRYEPTLHYFHQLLMKCGEESILVFDDIHWSAEMEKAWQAIKNHPDVRCTIDIFFLGFAFFRNDFKERQHFTIRF
ncbi:MAG: class I SAM-dependent methyltransferase [Flavisolibacter sp.]|nr:class I SAM-dependent methyltransferase [Flavisolibacter sp.]